MPIVDRFDFTEQERRFTAACAWLEDLGISVNGTRAAEYRGLLRRVAEYHERGRIRRIDTRSRLSVTSECGS